MLLDIKDLHVYYDKLEAVKGIDLHVEEGELVTIIGSNGAGKTSTLNAISGMVRRTGEIWYDGERIDHRSPAQIAARGIIQVPEGRRVFPLLSVLDNLRMGACLEKDKKKISERLERAFSLFPVLKERSGQRGDSLSGGEQQMLATARALMAGPRLLMIDEPSLGLSPIACQRVEDRCVEINQEGLTILLIEQNAKMGLRISSRCYVFEKGEIALEGKSSDLAARDDVKRAYLGV
jgi:branched-chain amino acid transport system ATP-binding protein